MELGIPMIVPEMVTSLVLYQLRRPPLSSIGGVFAAPPGVISRVRLMASFGLSWIGQSLQLPAFHLRLALVLSVISLCNPTAAASELTKARVLSSEAVFRSSSLIWYSHRSVL